MLRTLLGEPPRENEGLLAEAIELMAETVHLVEREMERSQDPTHDYRKMEVWTRGLISSLDELEQSAFAAGFFRKKVEKDFVEDMDPLEKSDYARYVYFYKDGFIRLFSLLDKLGCVLDDFFNLHTEKVKPHYSYFTVLRQFPYLKVHPALGEKLESIREAYKEPISVLRKRRNTEIHFMNAELQDDLWQKHQTLHGKIELEDLDQHMKDLWLGYEMACKSLIAVFGYINEQFHQMKVSAAGHSQG
ncbi:Cthe_2314 family HEPN domain-containing protein [Paenibacillus pinistramenti]|uniref:Cthe_2314 family HEPN domain-containing protein n=1 Tax=Paenibacillus pinistramenti TaxID=1768003 RepID=UPI0011089ECE|nr:Cthe_2314 family HEPN domain-containing protein [Paenibacillus pinistramenti]